ncbi:hypothetical protein D3C86_1904620 [compost metagenome]
MLQEKLLRAVLFHKTLTHCFDGFAEAANLILAASRIDRLMPIALSHPSDMLFHLHERAREIAR